MHTTDLSHAKGLLIDTTTCIGCKACVEACDRENGNPGQDGDQLSSRSFTVVQKRGDTFVRKLCMHCNEPTCVSVCPLGALTKRESGAVVWDSSICFGCRYCMVSCPYGIPTFEWNSYNPRIRKCVLCYKRIEAGRPTACAEACPTEATIFGDRQELIEIASERIRAHAERYEDHVLGLTEVGGSSVMYLSAIPFEALGFRNDLLQKPLPELTWRILGQVPNVILLGAWVLGGFYWIYRRREQVQAAEAHTDMESKKGGHGDA
jgi:formate dehydrogenase iron-sulfur subunit